MRWNLHLNGQRSAISVSPKKKEAFSLRDSRCKPTAAFHDCCYNTGRYILKSPRRSFHRRIRRPTRCRSWPRKGKAKRCPLTTSEFSKHHLMYTSHSSLSDR